MSLEKWLEQYKRFWELRLDRLVLYLTQLKAERQKKDFPNRKK